MTQNLLFCDHKAIKNVYFRLIVSKQANNESIFHVIPNKEMEHPLKR